MRIFLVLAFVSRFVLADIVPIQEVWEPQGTFDPAVYGKVAVLAWNGSQSTPVGVNQEDAEAFKQTNRETIESYVRKAAGKGAKMVLTPEFSIVGYPTHPNIPPEEDNFQNREEVQPYVEQVPGTSTEYFS